MSGAQKQLGSRQTVALQMGLRLAGVDPSYPEPERQAREFAANDLHVLSTLLHLSGQGELGLDAHDQLCLAQTLKHISGRLLMADDLLRMLNDATDELGELKTLEGPEGIK